MSEDDLDPVDPSADALLVALIALVAEDERNQIGIRLTIGGGVVDGVLVSPDRWFREFAAGIEESGADVVAGGLRIAAGLAVADGSTDEDLRVAGKVSRHLGSTDYIHLLNAATIVPTRTPVSASTPASLTRRPWRGRTAFVAGWSLSQTSLDHE